MSEQRVLLGFEVGTKESVTMPFHHAAFIGMTGKAGKTTAIEAASSRAVAFHYRTIGFITKRGEQAFENAKRLPLYFKERSDWQYVESLIEAKLTEDQRYNRAWIIKACRGTHSLRDVWDNVRLLKDKCRKDSLSERVYTVLDAYFELVIPELERYEFSSTLDLKEEGNYVMDLEGMPLAVQAVIIRSVLEQIYERMKKVIVVIPEAWKFIGTTHTPVTLVAQKIVREGYAVEVFLWADSQDIASINPKIRGQIDNWILGRQRYEHEIARSLKAMPIKDKPTKEQIMTLKLGHFYVACEDWIKHVYIWALGVPESVARSVSLGDLKPEYVKNHYLKKSRSEEDEEEMYKEKFEDLEKRYKELRNELTNSKELLEKLRSAKPSADVTELEEKLDTAIEANRVATDTVENLNKKIKELEKKNRWITSEEAKRCDQLEEAHAKLKPYQNLVDALAELMPKTATPSKKVSIINESHPEAIEVSVEQPLLVFKKSQEPLLLTQDTLQGRIIIAYAEGLLPFGKSFMLNNLKKIIETRFAVQDAYPNFHIALAPLVAWGYFEIVQAGKRRDYRVKMDPEEAKKRGLLKEK